MPRITSIEKRVIERYLRSRQIPGLEIPELLRTYEEHSILFNPIDSTTPQEQIQCERIAFAFLRMNINISGRELQQIQSDINRIIENTRNNTRIPDPMEEAVNQDTRESIREIAKIIFLKYLRRSFRYLINQYILSPVGDNPQFDISSTIPFEVIITSLDVTRELQDNSLIKIIKAALGFSPSEESKTIIITVNRMLEHHQQIAAEVCEEFTEYDIILDNSNRDDRKITVIKKPITGTINPMNIEEEFFERINNAV